MHYLHDHLKKKRKGEKKHKPEINYRVSFTKLLVRRINKGSTQCGSLWYRCHATITGDLWFIIYQIWACEQLSRHFKYACFSFTCNPPPTPTPKTQTKTRHILAFIVCVHACVWTHRAAKLLDPSDSTEAAKNGKPQPVLSYACFPLNFCLKHSTPLSPQLMCRK